MLELLDEIEQHVGADDVLPDGFLLVDSRHFALPRSTPGLAFGPPACRTCSGRRSGTREPADEPSPGSEFAAPSFPQRIEQQPEFGVSLVTIPEQNSKRLVFRDDRRSPHITLDGIEFFEGRNPAPVKHRRCEFPWSVSVNRSVPSSNPSDSAPAALGYLRRTRTPLRSRPPSHRQPAGRADRPPRQARDNSTVARARDSQYRPRCHCDAVEPTVALDIHDLLV